MREHLLNNHIVVSLFLLPYSACSMLVPSLFNALFSPFTHCLQTNIFSHFDLLTFLVFDADHHCHSTDSRHGSSQQHHLPFFFSLPAELCIFIYRHLLVGGPDTTAPLTLKSSEPANRSIMRRQAFCMPKTRSSSLLTFKKF